MESHKHYTQSETEFLLSCAETDENELLDYEEFVQRFHEPAKVLTWVENNCWTILYLQGYTYRIEKLKRADDDVWF